MPSTSGRSTPSWAEASIDARLCAAVGAELLRVRSERGLSQADVGQRLLLSVRQVRGLEEVDLAAFHNASFYLTALRKYTAFCELDPALVGRIAADMSRPVPGNVPRSDSGDGGTRDRLPRPALVVALLAAAVVAAGGGYLAWRPGHNGPSRTEPGAALPATSDDGRGPFATAPAPPSPAPEVDDSEPSALPEATVQSEVPESPAAFGTLRIEHATWVFLRHKDNSVTERGVAEGEVLELDSQPAYLAVGSPEAELTVAGRVVDTSPYVVNGQIRIGRADFDALSTYNEGQTQSAGEEQPR